MNPVIVFALISLDLAIMLHNHALECLEARTNILATLSLKQPLIALNVFSAAAKKVQNLCKGIQPTYFWPRLFRCASSVE